MGLNPAGNDALRQIPRVVLQGFCAAGLQHFDASVRSEPLDPTDPGVLAVVRRHPVGSLLALYNVTDTERPFPAWRLYDVGLEPSAVVDALTGVAPRVDEHGNYRLAPYAALWLVSP